MNSQKQNGEGTRNILLNDDVQLCPNLTGHSFQRTIIVNLFHILFIFFPPDFPHTALFSC